MNKYLIKIPFLGKRIYKNKLKTQADEELISSKSGTKYNTFQEFLRDAPEYSLDSSGFGTVCRNILRNMGVLYQQYVFIDRSSTEDKTAFLRREGSVLINGKGTYLIPWDSQKKIIYFDINDMRPLIDKTQDMDWYNPDACADVVTAITNANTMTDMKGENNDKKYLIIVVVLVAIAIIISVVGIYQGIETQKTVVKSFELLNNTLAGFR